MTDKELEAFEAGRDIDAEMVQSLREAKAGKTAWCFPPLSRRAKTLACLKPISPDF